MRRRRQSATTLGQGPLQHHVEHHPVPFERREPGCGQGRAEVNAPPIRGRAQQQGSVVPQPREGSTGIARREALKGANSIGAQVVQGQGIPTANLGQQIRIISPPRHCRLFLCRLLPGSPARGEQLRASSLIRREEHDYATGIHEALDLFGQRPAGQGRLPDQQARAFPIDLTRAGWCQDLGPVLQTRFRRDGQGTAKGLAHALVIRDHDSPAHRGLGKHEVEAIIYRIRVTWQANRAPSRPEVTVNGNAVSLQ